MLGFEFSEKVIEFRTVHTPVICIKESLLSKTIIPPPKLPVPLSVIVLLPKFIGDVITRFPPREISKEFLCLNWVIVQSALILTPLSLFEVTPTVSNFIVDSPIILMDESALFKLIACELCIEPEPLTVKVKSHKSIALVSSRVNISELYVILMTLSAVCVIKEPIVWDLLISNVPPFNIKVPEPGALMRPPLPVFSNKAIPLILSSMVGILTVTFSLIFIGHL